MVKGELRRSQRLGTYDSNGRDYLSSKLGWARSKFEEWMYSSSARPHLQQWYRLCIVDGNRFNDAVEWINTGGRGYFYNESDLEEDLFFMCLCAGNDGLAQDGGEGGNIDFARLEVDTEPWITQELWARTAWQIAQANRATGQIFHHAMQHHPAAAYGFAIEMLCIIFHSVAFRGAESVYLPLLKDGSVTGDAKLAEVVKSRIGFVKEGDEGQTDDETDTSSNSAADHTSDATFTDTKAKQPMSELSTVILATRTAPAERVKYDANSGTKIAPQGGDSVMTDPSLKTAERSSVDEQDKPEPLTPDTSVSVRGMAGFGGVEISRDTRVREWLEGTMRGRKDMTIR